MSSTDLVPIDNMAAIEAMDPATREVAVTRMLSEARQWLAHAVEATQPAAIAEFKAQMATVAEATRQMNLSKEIQTDAQEMVRRAERGLGVAIRQGQSRGEIATQGHNSGGPRAPYTRVRNGVEETIQPGLREPKTGLDSAAHYFTSGSDMSDTYALTDGVTDTQFDTAVTDARQEGNLSRANVIRKIKGVRTEGLTPVEKLVRIRELAPSGRTSQQIAREIGASEPYVRQIARDNQIVIIADEVTRNSRRLDANRVVSTTVMDASNVVSTSVLAQCDFATLNRDNLGEWISSLSESIKALSSLKKSLEKELHRG